MTQTDRVCAPFLDNGQFSYSATVRPVVRPAGHLNLRVTSQWAGARDPQAAHLALDVTLSRDDLRALIATLQAGLEQTV